MEQPRWIDYMRLDDLAPALRNPKGHDQQLIRASVSRFGSIDAPVLDERTGRLVAGHGRRDDALARRERGEAPPEGFVLDADGGWLMAVQRGWASASDDDADAAGIALNEGTIAGGWTNEGAELADVLADLRSRGGTDALEGTNYNGERLDALLADLAAPAPDLDPAAKVGADDDDVLPFPDHRRSVTGDVWQLGPHRLVVGTSEEDRTWALLDAPAADLVWTDPPYGVAYVGKTADAMTIDNDALTVEQLAVLLGQALRLTLDATRPGAVWFVAAPPGPAVLPFLTTLTELGVYRQMLIWLKDTLVLGHSDYHYRHELLLYGWTPGAAHHAPPARTFDSIYEYPRPKRSATHQP